MHGQAHGLGIDGFARLALPEILNADAPSGVCDWLLAQPDRLAGRFAQGLIGESSRGVHQLRKIILCLDQIPEWLISMATEIDHPTLAEPCIVDAMHER